MSILINKKTGLTRTVVVGSAVLALFATTACGESTDEGPDPQAAGSDAAAGPIEVSYTYPAELLDVFQTTCTGFTSAEQAVAAATADGWVAVADGEGPDLTEFLEKRARDQHYDTFEHEVTVLSKTEFGEDLLLIVSDYTPDNISRTMSCDLMDYGEERGLDPAVITAWRGEPVSDLSTQAMTWLRWEPNDSDLLYVHLQHMPPSQPSKEAFGLHFDGVLLGMQVTTI